MELTSRFYGGGAAVCSDGNRDICVWMGIYLRLKLRLCLEDKMNLLAKSKVLASD